MIAEKHGKRTRVSAALLVPGCFWLLYLFLQFEVGFRLVEELSCGAVIQGRFHAMLVLMIAIWIAVASLGLTWLIAGYRPVRGWFFWVALFMLQVCMLIEQELIIYNVSCEFNPRRIARFESSLWEWACSEVVRFKLRTFMPFTLAAWLLPAAGWLLERYRREHSRRNDE